jgi:hypothetical protein
VQGGDVVGLLKGIAEYTDEETVDYTDKKDWQDSYGGRVAAALKAPMT